MANKEQSKAISVRVKHVHRSRYNNQRRHDLRIGKKPSYVQESPEQPNRILVDFPYPSVMAERAEALRKKTGVTRAMRANAAVATTGIITFGVAAQAIFSQLTTDQQDAAYLEIAETIAQEHGTILRGLVVHVDETAPHAHAVWDTRGQDGVPMSRIMKGSRLQDIAAEVIDKHAPGIVRGERKAVRQERGDPDSKIYNRSVKQLHEDLPREIATKEAELAAKEAQLTELSSRVDEMQARVTKLEMREELNAKEQKRLDTYRKRLAARVAEYKAAQEVMQQRDAGISEREAALDMQSEALDHKACALDAAERELDQREDDLDVRDHQLELREIEVTKLTRYLQTAKDAVSEIIGDVADRLGVGASLRAIMDRIRIVERDLDQPDDDMSPM